MAQEMYSTHHNITLRDITSENLREILKLEVSSNQTAFVAPNAVSVAQAHFTETAWFKGIYAEGEPVGFVMLDDDSKNASYYLWRFMIDQRYQGKGYGKDALSFVVEYVKSRPGAQKILTSCVPGAEGPEAFYVKFGFKATGDFEEDEKVYAFALEAKKTEDESTIEVDVHEDTVGLTREFEFREELPNADALYALYDLLDWNAFLNISPEMLLKAMKGSYKALFVYSGDHLVGTGRLVSDGVINAYFCGLGVHPEFRNLGIGEEISRRLLEIGELEGLIVQLFCDEKLATYYERFGCKSFAVGMKRR